MSLFQFAPSIQFGSPTNYGYWQGAFSEEELQKIIDLGEQRLPQKAVVGGYKKEDDYHHIRESKVSWLELSDDTRWIYSKLATVIRNLNSVLYNFDMYGFAENLQYTVYEGDMKGHYDYHIDMMPDAGRTQDSARKLSCVLQLSDPSEYEGGVLELTTGSNPTPIVREKGYIVVFPSYLLHRVTPVTSGIRRSLVVWATGPSFR